MQRTEPHRPTLHWSQSIRFKLTAGMLALFLALVGSSLWLIWYQGLPLLQDQRHQLNEQIGENLVNSIQQHFSRPESISLSLARLAETLPYDKTVFQTLIPRLLDQQDQKTLIAGGGLWPEPFQFDPALENRSFFWGRDETGTLNYYDNYNDPAGPGYRNEEWYVPARLQNSSRVYWSRSYTDPYSLQPMVTCSAPFFLNGKFAGVSTVDLRLEGINKLLQDTFRDQAGYAFVVDRNNKFIAFPEISEVRVKRKGPTSQPEIDFMYTRELALKHPEFEAIASKLVQLNHRDENMANRASDETKSLAISIASASYQIDVQEARVIANNLNTRSPETLELLSHFHIDDDLILREPVDISIYLMPHTFWKVVSVFPVSQTTLAARQIGQSITWGSLAGIVIWALIFSVFLWKVLFRRLNTMTNILKHSAGKSAEVTLQQGLNDELGLLAYWYNQRTQQLHSALEQAQKNAHKMTQENNEHKLTSSLLEQSLTLQHAILDSANLIIIATDTSGMILSCNAGTSKLLGFREEDLIGKLFPHQLIDRPQLQRYQAAVQERLQQPISGFQLFTLCDETGQRQENEWLMTRKDGSQCTVLLSITPVINPARQMEGWLAVGSDISQRKQAEENLKGAMDMAERSNRAKTNFLANMSHELRTPLNAVLGFTRRLQKKLDNQIESRHMDALNTIERSAQHLMALINDLLDISKIEAGKMELNILEFNLNKLIADIYDETRALSAGKPLEYSCNLPKQTVMLNGDHSKIRQIIYNLLSNAFKATEHGAVDLTLTEPNANGEVHILVRDTGKGISPEDSRKLFQKFANLDNNVDGKASTGLGLYLTLKLVKMHGGNIAFESEQGKGTLFTIQLPLHNIIFSPA